jgi:hypothetical protein
VRARTTTVRTESRGDLSLSGAEGTFGTVCRPCPFLVLLHASSRPGVLLCTFTRFHVHFIPSFHQRRHRAREEDNGTRAREEDNGTVRARTTEPCARELWNYAREDDRTVRARTTTVRTESRGDLSLSSAEGTFGTVCRPCPFLVLLSRLFMTRCPFMHLYSLPCSLHSIISPTTAPRARRRRQNPRARGGRRNRACEEDDGTAHARRTTEPRTRGGRWNRAREEDDGTAHARRTMEPHTRTMRG